MATGRLALLAAAACCCALAARRWPSDGRGDALLQPAPAARETQLHILTARERGEFRAMQEAAHMKDIAAQVSALRTPAPRSRASGGRGRVARASGGRQQLAHWPYRHSSAVMGKDERLDTLGAAIHSSPPEQRQLIQHYILDEFRHKPGTPMLDDRRADYSEANPPCYTPEDCHRFAANQPDSHLQKQSDLPVYDNDMLELVSVGRMGRPDRLAGWVLVWWQKRGSAPAFCRPRRRARLPPKPACQPPAPLSPGPRPRPRMHAPARADTCNICRCMIIIRTYIHT